MTVSVIIPTYNRGYVIREAINSVLNQSYREFQILVIDDGSTDNTGEIVHSFNDNRIVYVKHAVNAGVSAARNTGLAAATGDLISFLDSDDLWKPNKLLQDVTFLSSHPEAGAVLADLERKVAQEFGSSAEAHPIFKRIIGLAGDDAILSERDMYLCLLQEMPTKLQAATFRRSAIESVGNFDVSTKSGEDWDFFVRFARKHRFGFINEVLVTERISPDSTFLRNLKQDYQFQIARLIREKRLVSDDREAVTSINKTIALFAASLAGRLRVDGEKAKSLQTLLLGFKETRRPDFLLRIFASLLPESVWSRLKRADKQSNS